MRGGVRRCVVWPVVLSQSGLDFRILRVQAQFEQAPGRVKIGEGFQVEHNGAIDGRRRIGCGHASACDR